MIVAVTEQRAPFTRADRDAWDGIIREHHQRVVVSVIALGFRPARAHELANEAWEKLFEKRVAGELETMSFPGLALAQARFLALDDLRAAARERRRREGLDAIRDLAMPADPPVLTGAQVQTIRGALAACSEQQQRVFRRASANPELPDAKIAEKVGLSVQRVRQIMCEVRKAIRDSLAEAEQP